MKRWIIKIWALLLMSFVGQGCTGTKIVADNIKSENLVTNQKLANSLLWKLSGDGLQDSYLYGTIHIIDDIDFFYPKGTMAALDKVTKIVFEIDMAEMSDMSNAMAMMQKAFMNDNKTLKDVMSVENYKMISDHFQKLGLPIFLFQRIKPMFLTIFSSGDITPGDLQSGKIKSYEMEFAKEAENRKLKTGGLETIDFQISVFDAIPYEDQANMLIESIKSADTGSDQFKEMVEIYKKQDISAMQDMMKGDETIEQYEDILLTKRNKNWIPQIKSMMGEESVFFAVGAGHLGGEMGVIKLLRNEGVKVTPVVSI
ncbi:MAG: TraB/GumN family protein [Saprospiraceae bacterium]